MYICACMYTHTRAYANTAYIVYVSIVIYDDHEDDNNNNIFVARSFCVQDY